MGTISDLKNSLRTWLVRSPGIESALRGFYFATHFHPVARENFARVSERLSASWMEDGIPLKQWSIVEPQLAALRAGKSNPAFDALADVLIHNVPQVQKRSILEIGCSSGYHSEILRCKGVEASYQGCDLSPAFIQLARQLYPSVRFDVEDATQLSYESNSFDIVISGCCLLHIADYEKAISEAARVSREFVVFHRTPVCHLSGPAFYTKKAYGVEMLEIHFQEQELVRMFARYNLLVTDVNSHSAILERERKDPLISKTYLCLKKN